MKKNHILILACSLHVGGGEKHLYNMISHLSGQKYEFTVCCLYELGGMGELLLNKKNVQVYHSLLKHKADLSGVMNMIRIMRERKPDIIYLVNTPLTLFWGMFSARIAGIKASLTRSPTTNPSAHVRRWKVVNLLILGQVDRVIAQANTQRDYLIDHAGADPENTVVIHNGVDLSLFNKNIDASGLRRKINIPEQAPVVGIVGRLEPQKGHRMFLSAARKIIDVIPDAHFLIIGDGSERENLERTASELLISGNVKFMGMMEDVTEVVSLFDVAVLSSKPIGETFSNAILEYMSASKPVVATNVGSIAEQVIDGKTGFLVPYGDPVMLSEKIIKLLNDSTAAGEMGKAGRKMAEERFSIKRMLSDYEDLFEVLLEQS